MKNPEIYALAEDVAEIIPEVPDNPKQSNSGLIKLFIAAFILLLIYLLANKFYTGPTVSKDGTMNVIGLYYGPVNTKNPNEIIVSLGKIDKNDVIETKVLQKASNQTDKPAPAPVKPAPTKNQLLAKIQIGTEFSKVTENLGAPDKILDITEKQKDSGFKMYLWNATPRIVCVFYKNKLISKL